MGHFGGVCMKRYLENYIVADLKKKMVFVGGPRQVGKTILSESVAKQFSTSCYLNLDLAADRQIIFKHQWPSADRLVIFDELHKYPRWKRWIKGVYDTKPEEQQYLVTGSARLDIYRKGGDSLLGRYHYWRLHPLTLDERPHDVSLAETYDRLLRLGGFPEPFLENDERNAKRWRAERFVRVIKEDLRDLENIKNIQLLELLAEQLRSRAGGLISYANLAADLEVAPKTIKNWIHLLENMYLLFCVYPYTKNISRAVKKAPKLYFYDNADCEENEAMRLENLVATHLLKRLQFREDNFGERCNLHYIRDRNDREVDFVTVIDGKVHELIEVKLSDKKISASLKYYKDTLRPEKTVQLVGKLPRSFEENGVLVTTPIAYFKNPPWE